MLSPIALEAARNLCSLEKFKGLPVDQVAGLIDASLSRTGEEELDRELKFLELIAQCDIVGCGDPIWGLERIRDKMRKLRADYQEAIEVLELLYDSQNGCPLPSYQKQWDQAMARAEKIFKQVGRRA